MQEQCVVMGQLMKLEGIYKCLEKLNKNGNFKIHLKKFLAMVYLTQRKKSADNRYQWELLLDSQTLKNLNRLIAALVL